jgi:hypothetical protein
MSDSEGHLEKMPFPRSINAVEPGHIYFVSTPLGNLGADPGA